MFLQVVDFERDINLIKSGSTNDNLIYHKMVGFKEDLSGTQNKPSLLESESEKSEASEIDSNTDDEETGSKFVNSARPKNETTEDKKVP